MAPQNCLLVESRADWDMQEVVLQLTLQSLVKMLLPNGYPVWSACLHPDRADKGSDGWLLEQSQLQAGDANRSGWKMTCCSMQYPEHPHSALLTHTQALHLTLSCSRLAPPVQPD